MEKIAVLSLLHAARRHGGSGCVNLITLAAALLHTKTWFELAPKAANIIVKDEKMGPEPIIKSLWAVTVVATIVILFVALYW